jgi:hypothetical protein
MFGMIIILELLLALLNVRLYNNSFKIVSGMILLNIFSQMKNSIREKVIHHENGLYLYLVFPIIVAFLITFVGARIISNIAPDLTIPWSPNIRVHHYAYGFFILAASGYLALVFSGPRAKYLISLLHGFGLGLSFDEFGIWLRLSDDDPARWSYDGFLIIVGVIFLIISARPGIKMLKSIWPFRD